MPSWYGSLKEVSHNCQRDANRSIIDPCHAHPAAQGTIKGKNENKPASANARRTALSQVGKLQQKDARVLMGCVGGSHWTLCRH